MMTMGFPLLYLFFSPKRTLAQAPRIAGFSSYFPLSGQFGLRGFRAACRAIFYKRISPLGPLLLRSADFPFVMKPNLPRVGPRNFACQDDIPSKQNIFPRVKVSAFAIFIRALFVVQWGKVAIS